MSIPVVNLADFNSHDPQLKQAFVAQLGKAFEETGFVAVKNHAISDALIAELYQHVQDFFELPVAAKKSYEIPGLAGQRGYTSFGQEHAKGYDAPDLKEFFQFGQEVTDGDPVKKRIPRQRNGK